MDRNHWSVFVLKLLSQFHHTDGKNLIYVYERWSRKISGWQWVIHPSRLGHKVQRFIGDSGYVNNGVVQSTKALMAIFISYGVCSPSLRMRNSFVNIYSSRVQNPTVVGIVTWNSLLRIVLIRNSSYSIERFGLF